MNRNRWTLLGVTTIGLSIIGLLSFDRSLDAQDQKDPPEKQPGAAGLNNPFAGKVLLVQKKYDTSPQFFNSPLSGTMDFGGFVLEDARITEVTGIRFLTGHGIERADGKPAGPKFSMPLDTIGTILEFENVEAYKRFEDEKTEALRSITEPGELAPAAR